eukprot:9108184-Pyramimonas_sp.AAC.1
MPADRRRSDHHRSDRHRRDEGQPSRHFNNDPRTRQEREDDRQRGREDRARGYRFPASPGSPPFRRRRS